jgi:hypothetical protein
MSLYGPNAFPLSALSPDIPDHCAGPGPTWERGKGMATPYFYFFPWMEISSTSKMRVALGPMACPAPRSP